eukprot:TRINITY_DN5547_c0_g2_i1.p1 TRINITY_DN5547_c0_g2~~TRINITY_DN5547_c0_g2_i1.p1  ORF type:complete len:659 (+),score=94.57 TRINITY_DN5547_c0_g2_i1:47-2023(+)
MVAEDSDSEDALAPEVFSDSDDECCSAAAIALRQLSLIRQHNSCDLALAAKDEVLLQVAESLGEAFAVPAVSTSEEAESALAAGKPFVRRDLGLYAEDAWRDVSTMCDCFGNVPLLVHQSHVRLELTLSAFVEYVSSADADCPFELSEQCWEPDGPRAALRKALRIPVEAQEDYFDLLPDLVPQDTSLTFHVGGSRAGNLPRCHTEGATGWHTVVHGSQLWALGPDIKKLPAADKLPPAAWFASGGLAEQASHVVRLDRGDTLFVPSGWWCAHVCLPGQVSVMVSKSSLLPASLAHAGNRFRNGRPKLLQRLVAAGASSLKEFAPSAIAPPPCSRVNGSHGFGVERVHFSQLSVADFRRHRVTSAEPLIIEGLAPFLTLGSSLGFSLEVLRDILQGDLEVPVRVRGRSVPKMELCDFFEFLEKGEDVYLADVSISNYFPWLYELVQVPRYFLHCFSHRTRQRNFACKGTPSLFIGPKGSRSTLHIDQLASNFFMFMAEGRKQWTCFHRDDTELLSYEWDNEEQIRRFQPLADFDPPAEARRVDFILEEGDVLFIPQGTPHEVVNETQTVAVSANFFDQTNVKLTVAQLRAKMAKHEEGAPRHANMQCFLNGLDEIEWPDLDDDLSPSDNVPQVGEMMVGHHTLHDELKSSKPLNFRTK